MIQRVLVVEDDPIARTVIHRMLARIEPDLSVEEAGSAEIAIRLLNQAATEHSPFDLVMADFQLPGASGLVLKTVCQELHPALDFLVVSGLSYEDWVREIAALQEMPLFLKKPVTEEKLRQFWRERYGGEGALGS